MFSPSLIIISFSIIIAVPNIIFYIATFSVSIFPFSRSPRKGLFSPKNLVVTSSKQVFGFDAPVASTPPSTTSTVTVFPSPLVSHTHNDHSRHAVANGFHTSPTIPVPYNSPANGHDYNYAVDGPFHEQNGSKTGQSGFTVEDRSENSVSAAISAKSFHVNRKISPPLNRPEHLRFT